jgi:MscS family membrane protein
MRRDEGLDAGLAEQAAEEVHGWRHSGDLPFPHVPHARAAELKGTLDYPPYGSPGASRDTTPVSAIATAFNTSTPGPREAVKKAGRHARSNAGRDGPHQYLWLNPSRRPGAPKDSA